MKLSKILPKDIKAEIPICYRDWDNSDGELKLEYISIFTPTIERVELLQKEIESCKDENIEILMVLVKIFTDIEIDIDFETKLSEFAKYFSSEWDVLQEELHEIFNKIIKEGLMSKERIMKLNMDSINSLEKLSPESAEKIKEIKQAIVDESERKQQIAELENELNNLKGK